MSFSDKTIEKFKYINLPPNHWDANVKELQQFSNPDLIKDWVENIKNKIDGKGLFITGPYGVGKSSCAAVLVKIAMGNGIYSYWLNYRDIPNLTKNRDMFNDNQTILERCSEVDLLVVDEVFIQPKNSRFPVDCLDDLIRNRVQNRKTTILTSNQTPKDLKEMVGLTGSLLAIMKEACNPVIIKGKDLRDA